MFVGDIHKSFGTNKAKQWLIDDDPLSLCAMKLDTKNSAQMAQRNFTEIRLIIHHHILPS